MHVIKLIAMFLNNTFIHLQIVGYLLLRNSSLFLCKRYSYFLAWFGKISLELFIVQYHIWLANDSHSKFLPKNLIFWEFFNQGTYFSPSSMVSILIIITLYKFTLHWWTSVWAASMYCSVTPVWYTSVLRCFVFGHTWHFSWTKSYYFGNSVPKISTSKRITNWFP